MQTFFPKSNNWQTISDKIERQIVGFDDKIMMVNVKFETGGIGSLHQHHHTQITHIAEGKFEVTIENDTQILEKGDSFFVPSNAMHGVVCIEKGLLIDIFSPMREDFL